MKRIILIVSLFSLSLNSYACSACIAQAFGSALHGLGAQTLPKDKSVISLTYNYFEETRAGELPNTTEYEHLNIYQLDYLYGATDNFLLKASLPYVNKGQRVTGQSGVQNQGLSDATLGVLYQIPPRMSDNFLTAFSLDVKLPTGTNNQYDSDGSLLEEHMQLGTGSTDVTLGVSFTKDLSHRKDLFYGGISERWNGANSRGFQFGNTFFYNIGMLHPLNRDSGITFEINGRVAQKDDLAKGGTDPDSGGGVTYLSLSYRRELVKQFGLIATYQQPIYKYLNGTKDEGGLVTFSLTKLM